MNELMMEFFYYSAEDLTPNGSLRRRRSRVPSEEEDTLMDYLRTSGHADGSRERKSTGNIRNHGLWFLLFSYFEMTVTVVWSQTTVALDERYRRPPRVDVVKIDLRVLYQEKVLEFFSDVYPIRVLSFFLRHITNFIYFFC